MATDTILVSDTIITPSLVTSDIDPIVNCPRNEINFSKLLSELFTNTVIITNTDNSDSAITIRVNRMPLENFVNALSTLVDINVKNIDTLRNSMALALTRETPTQSEVSMTRRDVYTVANFATDLVQVESELQSIQDDASTILRDINLPDVSLVPSNELLDKIAGVYANDELIDDILEKSSVLSADMGVESIANISTTTETTTADLDIVNFSDIINSNQDATHSEILKLIDAGIDSLFNAKALLSTINELSSIDITDVEKSSLSSDLNIMEQDWSATLSHVATNTVLTAVHANADYVAYITKIAVYNRNADTFLIRYTTTDHLINTDTIAYYNDATLNTLQVVGNGTSKPYPLSVYRGILSTLKSYWNGLTSRICSSRTFANVLSAAATYVNDKLVNINKVYGTSFDAAGLSTVVSSGFGTITGSTTVPTSNLIKNVATNIIPLCFRGLSNKLEQQSLSKNTLLNRVRDVVKINTAQITPAPTGYSNNRRYRLIRRKNVRSVRKAPQSITSLNMARQRIAGIRLV
ncbi:hypothetical protein 7 [Hubei insect virus 2]|uniref:hypothetical protein 7 n=1 Tax=Hubei insect virus 2 TaxID=1922898 RepID=UPI00090C597C|nr:hypothetical protein 7 [Hubei insect virus 2]APG79064.1 hypothetical protein 7 [Hubei insect virus 2]